MLQGLKIYTYRDNSVKISSGTNLTDSINGVMCSRQSFLTKNDWREPSQAERDILYETSNNHTSHCNLNFVTLVQIPNLYFNLFNKCGVTDTLKQEQMSPLFESNKFKHALNEYAVFLKQIHKGDNELLKSQGLHLGKANLAGTAFDAKINQYVGLHFDSWDTTTLGRENARNRICLNLSEESRYLTIINLTYNQICSVLQIDYETYKMKPSIVRNLFLTKFPDYPVIQIEIKSGEAYIAPTDNILHDGNSMGKKKKDVSITFLGNFNFDKLKNVFKI